jgi:hypothetical protein
MLAHCALLKVAANIERVISHCQGEKIVGNRATSQSAAADSPEESRLKIVSTVTSSARDSQRQQYRRRGGRRAATACHQALRRPRLS